MSLCIFFESIISLHVEERIDSPWKFTAALMVKSRNLNFFFYWFILVLYAPSTLFIEKSHQWISSFYLFIFLYVFHLNSYSVSLGLHCLIKNSQLRLLPNDSFNFRLLLHFQLWCSLPQKSQLIFITV